MMTTRSSALSQTRVVGETVKQFKCGLSSMMYKCQPNYDAKKRSERDDTKRKQSTQTMKD